jgi:hypothetical protein
MWASRQENSGWQIFAQATKMVTQQYLAASGHQLRVKNGRYYAKFSGL